MSSVRTLLLILLALLMPFQMASAWAMLSCQHAAGDAQGAVAENLPCHEHEAMPAMEEDGDAPAATTDCTACDNCGICHLAGSGYLPVSAASSFPTGAADQPAATRSLEPPSHIGDPPYQPPRRLN